MKNTTTVKRYDPKTREWYNVEVKDLIPAEKLKPVIELTPEEIDKIMRGNTKL